MKTKVDEWKKRKAIHEVDPIELLKNNSTPIDIGILLLLYVFKTF